MNELKAAVTDKKIAQILNEEFAQFKKNPKIEPLFVFPTEVQKNSWIEWAVKNPDESGVEAVNTDQFIAWDIFKSQYICAKEEKKSCIPALIRKFFAQKILKESGFKKIISSDKITEQSIFAFTDWLSKILPSLALFEKHYKNDFKKNIAQDNIKDDDENLDLMEIYQKYCSLLESYNFYEPSYAAIDFKSFGRKIFIFYPLILQDFCEYYEYLACCEDVTFVLTSPINEDEKNDFALQCVNYGDARKELRKLALQIKKLQIEQDVDLRRIAVNVPNLEEVKPYIEREFRLYDIPFVVRNGPGYSKNCGGDIFAKIKDCIDFNCSFDAFRNLLLDGFIPWKDEKMNLRLIQIGVKHRIVCSIDEKRDLWFESLEENSEYEEEKNYYILIKNSLEKFKNAKSFRQIKEAWFDFSQKFIDETKYETQEEIYGLTDKVLGRIVTELCEYISIEEEFNNFSLTNGSLERLTLDSYFNFFVNEVNQKAYAQNIKKYGVNIFDYRIASCADFDYQFIINANQNDITVPLKSLSFIKNETKRKLLGLEQEISLGKFSYREDASASFVELYNAQYKSSPKKVYWSSSKNTFNGAAITHTALKEFDFQKFEKDFSEYNEAQKNNKTEKIQKLYKKYGDEEKFKKALSFFTELNDLDKYDFVKNPKSTNFSLWQKESFDAWASKISIEENENQISKKLEEKIKSRSIDSKSGFVKISASSMNCFFPCPKKWLYQNVMGIDDEKYYAKFAESNEIGNIYHKTLELMFGNLKGKHLPCYQEDDIEKVQAEVSKYLLQAIEAEKDLEIFNSILSTKILESQKPIIEKTLVEFVMQFCKKAEDESNLKGNFGGLKVEDTEKSLFFYDEKNKIFFNGKIDCILSNGTIDDCVNAIIIDYKTGMMPSAKESLINKQTGKIENFQMAMYVKLLEKEKNEDGLQYKVQNGLFYSLKKDSKTGSFGMNYVITENPDRRSVSVNREGFVLTQGLFDEYAVEYKNKILTKDFKISSIFEDKNYVNFNEDCAGCRFKTSCRTTFSIGQKI